MYKTTSAIALASLLFLAACESDEERAAGHFESATELYAAGDAARAVVELRNVLKIDGGHREARLMFAQIAWEDGKIGEARDSYLRVVEQYPDDVDALSGLAEAAIISLNWDEVNRHGRTAIELAPNNPRVQAIGAMIDYRQALIEENDENRGAALDLAETLVLNQPDNVMLQGLLSDGRLWRGDRSGALDAIDAAIALLPQNKSYYLIKLNILGQVGDEEAIEAHLRTMAETYPGDEEIKATLIRYLVSTGNEDDAEGFFRSIADPTAENIGTYIALVRFIADIRGPEAALAELETSVDITSEPVILRSLRAGYNFDLGQTEEAIAELEDILTNEPPQGMAGNLRIALAQMLAGTGNEVGARRRVEEVLEFEPGHVEALKMQAAWLTEADEADDAIRALRSALSSEPRDVEAMMLLAAAYGRNGSHELARDALALAVETSEHAPAPTLRYASVLVAEERYRVAERVLVEGLRRTPESVEILSELGRTYVLSTDFPRGQGVLERLERLGGERALAAASQLRLALLSAQQRTDELLGTLEEMATDSEGDVTASILLVRTYLAEGNAEAALETAEKARDAAPEDTNLRLAYAATKAATGDPAAAIAEYQAMIGSGAADPRVWRLLASMQSRTGDATGARETVDAALAAYPTDPDLMWFKASLLERDGDLDGAISVYEDLYEANSGSPVVANNLASLLSTVRGDPESVERAFQIARRLRGTEVPAFQDTYGWLLHLRGQSEDAIDYLEPAAKALSGDPLVQFHLGMALLETGKIERAKAQLEQALELAGEGDGREQFQIARAELDRLASESETETTE
ncbi:MAG: tetratricopeptide repeat protein [Pseudomonadota bacterium]